MMTETEFRDYCARLGLAEKGVKYLEKVRSSPPSRAVRSNGTNVTVRVPSVKMGHTVQAEAYTTELVLIRHLEHSDHILEYWDQPGPIRLRYRSKEGRTVTVSHTPDFLVFERDRVVFFECKAATEMSELVQRMPERYTEDQDGSFRCPPGQETSAELGIHYEVYAPNPEDTTRAGNLAFLGDFDSDQAVDAPSHLAALIKRTVYEQPGISVAELREVDSRIRVEHIYRPLALGEFVEGHFHGPTDHPRVFG